MGARALKFVEENPVFGTSLGEVTAHSRVLGVRRSQFGFELSVGREVTGFPVQGGPQRLLFDSEGRIQGFNKGFITNAERRLAQQLASRTVDARTTLSQAQNYVEMVWRSGSSAGLTPPTLPLKTERTYDATLGRMVDVVRLTDDLRRVGFGGGA